MNGEFPLPTFALEEIDAALRGQVDHARLRRLLDSSVDAPAEMAPAENAELWLAHGRARESMGDLNGLRADAEQARVIAAAVGDHVLRGRALVQIAMVEHRWGHHELARVTAQEATLLIGDHADIVRATATIGASWFEQSRYAEAEEWYQRAIDHARRLNERVGLGNNLHNLAMIKLWQGSFDLSLRYAAEANEYQIATHGVGYSLAMTGAYAYQVLNQRIALPIHLTGATSA